MAGTEDLCLEMNFGHDLLDSSTLDRLQAWLVGSSPAFSSELEVLAYDGDRQGRVVDGAAPGALREACRERGLERGETYQQLVGEDASPGTRRRFGQVAIQGRQARGCQFGVRFDSMVPAMPIGDQWLWSNSIDVRLTSQRVDGQDRADWLGRLGDVLAEDEGLLWGAAYLQGEFEASNIDTTHGVRAIGRDVRRHLPGLYWRNYFGAPYAGLMHVQAARQRGLGRWHQTGHVMALQAYDLPQQWTQAQTQKRQLLEALGSDLFFDRTSPSRHTRAPDLGLPALRDRPAFEVVTSDGEHFTPIPQLKTDRRHRRQVIAELMHLWWIPAIVIAALVLLVKGMT